MCCTSAARTKWYVDRIRGLPFNWLQLLSGKNIFLQKAEQERGITFSLWWWLKTLVIVVYNEQLIKSARKDGVVPRDVTCQMLAPRAPAKRCTDYQHTCGSTSMCPSVVFYLQQDLARFPNEPHDSSFFLVFCGVYLCWNGRVCMWWGDETAFIQTSLALLAPPLVYTSAMSGSRFCFFLCSSQRSSRAGHRFG